MTSHTRPGKPQLIFLDENFLYKNDHYSSIFKSPQFEQNISVRNLSQRIRTSIVDITLCIAIILIKYFSAQFLLLKITDRHKIDICCETVYVYFLVDRLSSALQSTQIMLTV